MWHWTKMGYKIVWLKVFYEDIYEKFTFVCSVVVFFSSKSLGTLIWGSSGSDIPIK